MLDRGRRQFLKDPIWWGRQPGQPASLLSAIDPDEHAHIRNRLAPAFTPKGTQVAGTAIDQVR